MYLSYFAISLIISKQSQIENVKQGSEMMQRVCHRRRCTPHHYKGPYDLPGRISLVHKINKFKRNYTLQSKFIIKMLVNIRYKYQAQFVGIKDMKEIL